MSSPNVKISKKNASLVWNRKSKRLDWQENSPIEDLLEASKRETNELNVNLECFRKRVVEKTTELNKLRRGSSTAKTRLKIRFEAKIKSLEEELAKSLGKIDTWKKKYESLKGVSSLLANENRDLRSSQLKKKLDEAYGELQEATG